MQDEGILFAVLPISVLVERGTKDWRKEVLLKNNRLLGVITFPDDLFYPVSVGTIGLFIKKGIPHNYEKDKVYFVRCINDGFVKKKGVRKESPKVRNMLEEIKDELKDFIISGKVPKEKNIAEFKKVCLLDEEDKDCELVAEAYIESAIPSFDELKQGLDEMIREAIAFKIKYSHKLEEIQK
jgi:type I restriction-modification system DNA methylase subunit